MVKSPISMETTLRSHLGRRVHEVWVRWAKQQPNPDPKWLIPWEELSPQERERDCQLGEELYRLGRDSVMPLARMSRHSTPDANITISVKLAPRGYHLDLYCHGECMVSGSTEFQASHSIVRLEEELMQRALEMMRHFAQAKAAGAAPAPVSDDDLPARLPNT